jgi:hypothetical protein
VVAVVLAAVVTLMADFHVVAVILAEQLLLVEITLAEVVAHPEDFLPQPAPVLLNMEAAEAGLVQLVVVPKPVAGLYMAVALVALVAAWHPLAVIFTAAKAGECVTASMAVLALELLLLEGLEQYNEVVQALGAVAAVLTAALLVRLVVLVELMAVAVAAAVLEAVQHQVLAE